MPNVDLNKLREVEDAVKTQLDKWSTLELLIAFSYIKRSTNISMDGIDRKIVQEAIKRQQGG